MRKRILLITTTALFTAMNIVMSSSIMSIPVAGGHMYFNDIIIGVASILLGPLYAFVVGGIGAFLGDFFFYPTPMFVSLVTHGIQAIVISLFANYIFKNRKIIGSILGVFLGAVINVVGYTIGRSFFYATIETAMLKLPFQILQASVGAVLAIVLIYPLKLGKAFHRMLPDLTPRKGNQKDLNEGDSASK